MPRITVTISDALDEYLEKESGEGGEADSKSEVMRSLAERGRDAEDFQERIDELEEELAAVRNERDQLQEQAEHVDDLETKVERLENEKRLILEQREENAELVEYIEQERNAEQQWREAGLWTKTKWKVFGMPADESPA
jgi:predicted  nucleic acid-binding Zn-ribbon protein